MILHLRSSPPSTQSPLLCNYANKNDNNSPCARAGQYSNRFLALSIFSPLWLTTYLIKALVLLTDHFQNVKLLHETNSNEPFNPTMHLNFTERTCYRLLWRLSPPGLFGEEDIMRGRWYQGYTIPTAMIVTLVISLGVQVPLGLYISGCFSSESVGYPGCLTASKMLYPLAIGVALWAPSLIVILAAIRRVRDKLFLHMEIAAHYVLFVVIAVIAKIAAFDNTSGTVNATTAIVMCSAAFSSLSVSLLAPAVIAIARNARRWLRRDRLPMQQTTESFQRLLADRELFAKFKKVLAEHFSLENGLFWDDFREIEESVSAHRPESAMREDLNRLYAQYIPPNSPRELNLMSSTRDTVMRDHAACRLSVTSFAPVKKEVFDMMYSHSLPQFLQQQQMQSRKGGGGGGGGGITLGGSAPGSGACTPASAAAGSSSILGRSIAGGGAANTLRRTVFM
ncbi:hypothetical protein BC828DRAFT_395191 [Blastocladiella britannica]|nr:hypothetical protein BC828DRAFT_395191 [Blastocladiella britannica]